MARSGQEDAQDARRVVYEHTVTICVPSQQVEELLTELVRGAGVDTAILTMNASRCGCLLVDIRVCHVWQRL